MLINYIVQHGPKWAEIKKIDGDGLLKRWSQRDLGSKVDNMHERSLKMGEPLPQNFEQVTLHRKHREELERMGILGLDRNLLDHSDKASDS